MFRVRGSRICRNKGENHGKHVAPGLQSYGTTDNAERHSVNGNFSKHQFGIGVAIVVGILAALAVSVVKIQQNRVCHTHTYDGWDEFLGV